MQPPGRISLFFVAAGSSPAGLFSVSRSVFCQSVCVAASRPAFSPAACLFCRLACFCRPTSLVAGRNYFRRRTVFIFRRAFAFGCSALLPGHLLCAGPAGPVFDPFRFPPGLCLRTLCLVAGASLCAGPAGPVFGSFRFPPGPYFVGPSVCRWQRSSCRFSSRGVTGLVIRASHPASSARRRSVSKA